MARPPAPSSSPRAPAPRQLLKPLERFFRIEASSGFVLLAATVVALLWANSRWSASYESLWHLTIALSLGAHAWAVSPHFVVNDGLMTIFFLLAGLEIRRETHGGALSSARAAAVPIVAALGGMVAPALIYLALADSGLRHGWAIPTATDIAFAIGALSLLGKRVPRPVRVLLLALAIIDDVGAVLVIGFFYSSGIDGRELLLAGVGVAATLVLQRFGVRSALAYILSGAIVWIGLDRAGVHPALAGVILGLLTPVQGSSQPVRGSSRQQPQPMRGPAERLQLALHPWVAYGIMPLFALANAGVALRGTTFSAPGSGALIAAVVVALVLGKPLGIFVGTWLAARGGFGALAPALSGRGVLLAGCLGGIGFTMSLFLATLAFDDSPLLATAKAAVLLGSAVAGLIAIVLGRVVLFPTHSEVLRTPA